MVNELAGPNATPQQYRQIANEVHLLQHSLDLFNNFLHQALSFASGGDLVDAYALGLHRLEFSGGLHERSPERQPLPQEPRLRERGVVKETKKRHEKNT